MHEVVLLCLYFTMYRSHEALDSCQYTPWGTVIFLNVVVTRPNTDLTCVRNTFPLCNTETLRIVDHYHNQLISYVPLDNKKIELPGLANSSCSGCLRINFSKTEYLALSTERAEVLGSILYRKGTLEVEMRGRTEQARKVIRMTHSILWKSNIPNENKLSHSGRYLGLHIWHLNPTLLKRPSRGNGLLEAVHMCLCERTQGSCRDCQSADRGLVFEMVQSLQETICQWIDRYAVCHSNCCV